METSRRIKTLQTNVFYYIKLQIFFNTEISPSFHLNHNSCQIIVLLHLAHIQGDIIN